VHEKKMDKEDHSGVGEWYSTPHQQTLNKLQGTLLSGDNHSHGIWDRNRNGNSSVHKNDLRTMITTGLLTQGDAYNIIGSHRIEVL